MTGSFLFAPLCPIRGRQLATFTGVPSLLRGLSCRAAIQSGRTGNGVLRDLRKALSPFIHVFHTILTHPHLPLRNPFIRSTEPWRHFLAFSRAAEEVCPTDPRKTQR